MPAAPGILPGEFLIEVHAVPIRIHEPGQYFFPELDGLACNMDILVGEFPLETLLKEKPISLRPFCRSLHQRMEMRVIHCHHPHPNSGDFRADGHAVPSEHFVFVRIEQDVRPGSVGKDMPNIINRFFHLLFCARYTNLSVFAKRETNKNEKRPYTALQDCFRPQYFNQNEGLLRKKGPFPRVLADVPKAMGGVAKTAFYTQIRNIPPFMRWGM